MYRSNFFIYERSKLLHTDSILVRAIEDHFEFSGLDNRIDLGKIALRPAESGRITIRKRLRLPFTTNCGLTKVPAQLNVEGLLVTTKSECASASSSFETINRNELPANRDEHPPVGRASRCSEGN